MKGENVDKKLARNTNVKLILVALFCWLSVDLIYVASGVDWINDTDTGWYWNAAGNLRSFNSGVQPGFPLITVILVKLLPRIPPAILMQAVSLLAYTAMVPLLYQVFRSLNVSLAWQGSLLMALFPLTGVNNAILPRVDAMLNLFIVLAVLGYVKRRNWMLILALGTLPLLHRSPGPFMGLIILTGLWERRIKFWMLAPVFLPVATYWIAGAIHHGQLLWYLRGFPNNPESILGLPVGDGLLGVIVLGLRGSLLDLIQGALVVSLFSLALFLLFSRVWKGELFLISLTVSPIFLALTLPESEIQSTVDYSTYIVVPLVVYLHRRNIDWLNDNRLWLGILISCFLTQIAFGLFVVSRVT